MNALCRAEGPVACAHACFGDTDGASLVEKSSLDAKIRIAQGLNGPLPGRRAIGVVPLDRTRVSG
jgi:hypothetical protein